ncbi:MAG TPA: hypothetical protein VHN14_23170 [Kofleriaceae bacterium]|jgi:hypothetical protein|nr:hypothetical protein [Kofleriaceae bacterium]
MRIRASRATITQATALLAAIWAGAGCTHAGGQLMVDIPKMLPYQAPDIDEITGIDSSDLPEDAGTHPGAAQPPHK